MSHNLKFENEYIEEIYKKRKQVSKLKQEIDKEILEIKTQLKRNGMLYASTDKFALYLNYRYKANEFFIKLLEDKNMVNYITKVVTAENFKQSSEVLGIKDLSKYREISCETLYINKKDDM